MERGGGRGVTTCGEIVGRVDTPLVPGPRGVATGPFRVSFGPTEGAEGAECVVDRQEERCPGPGDLPLDALQVRESGDEPLAVGDDLPAEVEGPQEREWR